MRLKFRQPVAHSLIPFEVEEAIWSLTNEEARKETEDVVVSAVWHARLSLCMVLEMKMNS